MWLHTVDGFATEVAADAASLSALQQYSDSGKQQIYDILVAATPTAQDAVYHTLPRHAHLLVLGDLHGNGSALVAYLNEWRRRAFITNEWRLRADVHLVVCGDYLDRGWQSLLVVAAVAKMKAVNPSQVCMLAGNHERGYDLTPPDTRPLTIGKASRASYCDHVAKNKVFTCGPSEWRARLGLESARCLERLQRLPVASLITMDDGRRIFCSHGGLPIDAGDVREARASTTLQQQSPTLSPAMIQNCLWGDYTCDGNDADRPIRSRHRGGETIVFPRTFVREWMRANNISSIVRGHQHSSSLPCPMTKYITPQNRVVALWCGDGVCKGAEWEGQVFTVISYGNMSAALPSRYIKMDIPLACLEFSESRVRVLPRD